MQVFARSNDNARRRLASPCHDRRDHRVAVVVGRNLDPGAAVVAQVPGVVNDRVHRPKRLDRGIDVGGLGAAIGAAACGMRPIAELMFLDFMGVCFDQIFNQAAKFRYMFGGKAETPVVIRAMVGAGFRAAAQHSQMLTPLFTHIPGLKVVCPSNAYDAKGLLIQSIRDNDPVIFCEHKNLYGVEADVPAESYAIPFGEANIVRDGKHATIITYGMMVQRALDAAAALAKQGIECEVVDLRTLSPIDWDTVIDSAERTGHVVCVDEAHPRCSIAADVSAMITQECFKALKGPIQMVTAPHTPVPFSPTLEDLYIPSADAIAKAVKKSMGK